MTGMRRNDKEIHNPGEIAAIIRRAEVCRLGLCDGTSPYVVPVCFGYEPGVLWIHSAKEGKKIDLIAAHPHVSFEFDEVSGVVPAESPCAGGDAVPERDWIRDCGDRPGSRGNTTGIVLHHRAVF